jgi:hypothetical protein
MRGEGWAAPSDATPRTTPRQRLCSSRTSRTGVRAKSDQGSITMSKLLRGAVAGVGAWKLGGGVIGTVLIFILLWIVLGNFGMFQ